MQEKSDIELIYQNWNLLSEEQIMLLELVGIIKKEPLENGSNKDVTNGRNS